MKGLQEKTETNAVFLVVKHHSICQESKTEREGFRPVDVKNPRTDEIITKYVKQYKAVEGYVDRIEWYDTEERYDTRYLGWKIHLNADGTPAVLDLPFSSRACSRFMRLVENLDFNRPVEFTAWYDNKSDATAFNVKQNGKSVPQLYTRENPGDCPPPTKNFQGKWNFDAPNEFLHRRMMEVVIPAVDEARELREAGAEVGAHPWADTPAEELTEEDIPF